MSPFAIMCRQCPIEYGRKSGVIIRKDVLKEALGFSFEHLAMYRAGGSRETTDGPAATTVTEGSA